MLLANFQTRPNISWRLEHFQQQNAQPNINIKINSEAAGHHKCSSHHLTFSVDKKETTSIPAVLFHCDLLNYFFFSEII